VITDRERESERDADIPELETTHVVLSGKRMGPSLFRTRKRKKFKGDAV